MSLLRIPYGKYVLTLEFENPELQFQLTPDQFSSQESFIYVSKLGPQNMDHLLKLLFSSVENIWKYLSFYKQKALSIDFGRIEEDNKNPSRDSQHKGIDLPISVKLIMLEGIGTAIKLKGDMILESLEKRLAKSNEEIKRLKGQVQELKQELALNQVKLLQFHQLQEENAELKRKLENQEKDRSRPTDVVLPRKRIHLSQDHLNQSKPLKASDSPSNIKQISMVLKNSQNQKAPQPIKGILDASHESSPSQSNSSELDDKIEFFASNSSSKKSKKSKKSNRNQTPSQQFQIAEQENTKKLPETDRKENQTKDLVEQSFDEDFSQMNSYNMVNQNSFGKKPTVISKHREKLQESDQAKLIQSFAEKCLTEVGYTEKGESKTGYVCVFCEKIFKQPEFLNKHIFTRHQQVLESHVNETYLMGKLNTYKLSRDAAFHAQLRNKKIEKLKSSFIDNR